MTVKELINLLQKCPEDYIVMYSMETALDNESLEIKDKEGYLYSEVDFSVDDALVCSGTLQRFVLLTADSGVI